MTFFLRKEPFGGVIYCEEKGTINFLSSSAYEILYALAKGLDDNEITKKLESKFILDDIECVKSDINKFRNMLSDKKISDKRFIEVPNENSAIPTLSSPLELHWEITNRCNLRCSHCYNNSKDFAIEPTLEQISSVIEELKNYSLRGLIISGGEPLLHKDIEKILRMVRPLADEIILATNGTLINNTNIKWLKKYVDTVNISVDVGNAEGFDGFRGVNGAFEQCINGLRILKKYKILTIIQTTISKFNINNLDELAELLIAEGTEHWIVRHPIKCGRANNNKDAFLTRKELVDSEELFQEIRKKYFKNFKVFNIGNSYMWSYKEKFNFVENKKYLVSCAAGTIKATIKPNGTLTPCALFGNTNNFCSKPVWNGNFISEWKNADCMNTMRSISLEKIKPCYNCGHFETCLAGCRAKAFLTGDMHQADLDCNYVNPLF